MSPGFLLRFYPGQGSEGLFKGHDRGGEAGVGGYWPRETTPEPLTLNVRYALSAITVET